MKYLILIVMVLGLTGSVKPQTIIYGEVKDEEGKVVYGANIVLKGTIDGATTDEKGYYEFETEKTGNQILICSALEYAEYTKQINVSGEKLKADIKLYRAVYETEEIIVTASTFTSGEHSKVTLTPLEIVRIPGADADLFRAITTFPGSNQVDEGSRIAVRGGDPNEVLTFLDNASLYNPFIFQDAYNTQSFSTVNPWGLKGINFSSGGFSARFGNVLSAVLDLKSYDVPTGNGMFAFLGLANASLQGAYATTDGKFGASFTSYQFIVKPFMELNGIEEDYNKTPTATGIGGMLVYKTSETGIIKLYANYDYSKLGIRSNSPSYTGYFNSEANSFFTNLKYSFAPTSVSALSMSFSMSDYNNIAKYGVLDNRSDNLYSKFRADFAIPFSNKFDFSAGAEYEFSEYKLNGDVPLYFYNLKPGAPSLTLREIENTGRAGFYSELTGKLTGKLAVIGGLRSDYYTISKEVIIDPRLSIVYKITDNSYLKGAAGIYHQNPALNYFVQSFGKKLLPEKAIHYILGYEYNRDGDYIFRVESYYKDYMNLVLFDRYYQNFSSDGYGFAKGIDAFLKVRFRGKFNGWISYSLTDSRRKQYNATGVSPANFDITHNFSIVGEYNLSDVMTIGAIYRISTGSPYTPVTGSVFNQEQNVYIPIYAEENTGRMPTYTRFDMNYQYYTTLFNRFTVLVLAISNILNTNNLNEYTYTADYGVMKGVSFNNPRTVYIAIGMQF